MTTPSANPGAALADVDQSAVSAHFADMMAKHLAQEMFRAAIAPHDRRPQPDAAMLSELLVRPSEPSWRIEDVLPTSGRMLLVAQRKLGKTTLTGNLARSLLTGEPFLGRYPVRAVEGRVVALNYEVTAGQYARWMSDIGVPAHRLYVINMRGRRNLLADAEGRAELADHIKSNEGEVVIVDPFGRAYTGKSQNDTAEVTPWLSQLDEVTEESGAQELVVTAHAGWANADRSRGSSGLEDWPDVIVAMTGDQGTGHRFIKADGRDVHLDEDRLDFDPATRHLTVSGAGSRSELREAEVIAQLAVKVAAVSAAQPGINVAGLEAAIPGQRSGHVGRAAAYGHERGLLVQVPGKRGAKLHYPPEPPPTPPGALTPAP